MDVDILNPEDLENHARVIAALKEPEDHAAAAIGTALNATINGVKISYLDRKTLIQSKTTEQARNKVDVERLLSLNRLDS